MKHPVRFILGWALIVAGLAVVTFTWWGLVLWGAGTITVADAL